MREQDGKFLLFDINEFAAWLTSSSFARVIKLLQVHHTFQPDYTTFHRVKDHFSLLKSMERAQMVERGFSEIAQNLTTFPDGLVAVCRPLDNIPAGIKGANQHGICVENLGNFDANQDVMAPEHRDCILKLFSHLCRRFNLNPDCDTIQYHHWWDLNSGKRTNGSGITKTCPGTEFFSGNSLTSAQTNFIPLVVQQLSAIAAGVVPAAPSPYTAEVAVDLLNVRVRPSPSATVLKQLNRGVEVRVYEEHDRWSRIDPVSPCWVNSDFLHPATTSKTSVLYCAQVTADLLNVRSLPSPNATIVKQLERGTVVYVYEERNQWRRVEETASLWVSSRYLARTLAAAL